MIINLWSTPRTGSNWYALYLLNERKKDHPRVEILPQYLNKFHLNSYTKTGYGDLLFEYQRGCCYPEYFFNNITKTIQSVLKFQPRVRDFQEEENHRIKLLSRHNSNRINLIAHNHVLPMSKEAYDFMFKIADRNVFLYRENLVDQLSSYALAYGTKVYKTTKNHKIYQNIGVEEGVLKNLCDRILYWHSLDKTGCEVVKYESLDFNYKKESMPRKQNIISAFDQLDNNTQELIIRLAGCLKESISLL